MYTIFFSSVLGGGTKYHTASGAQAILQLAFCILKFDLHPPPGSAPQPAIGQSSRLFIGP
jgi:hypothetical protein